MVGIYTTGFNGIDPFVLRFEQILQFNNIESVRLSLDDPDFWKKLEQISLFIYRWEFSDYDKQLAKTIMPIIERKGILCFPNQETSWHYDDKIKQYYLLKEFNLPYTESYVFWSKSSALDWIMQAQFPVVFKLKGGAGSKNVKLIKKKKTARRIVKRMFGKGKMPNTIDRNKINLIGEVKHLLAKFERKLRGGAAIDNWQKEKDYVLFQKYLPDNEYDTRVTVIGNRAFAFRRKVRSKDFRASGSGIIEYKRENINLDAIKVAFETSKKLKFQSMAYDFLFNEMGNPEFCEISYTYVDTAIYNCPGYWDQDLNWHEGHYWPQYFILVDLLGVENLKQPQIEIS
ncbi:MAG: hypothetical protein ACFFDF_10305 [Candidatus Odinarchaeota archaeon]